MTRDIVDKLGEHLSRPVDTECAVVYLLAEVRKVLERERPDPKPFALWMCCHWALHVDLSHERTTLDFLQRVDNFVLNSVTGLPADGNCSFRDEQGLFREFLYLETFRAQLGDFLASYSLPTRICDDDEAWLAFATAYGDVIEDGSLSCRRNGSLKAIESVTFVKREPSPFDGESLLSVRWEIKLQDGRMLTADFETTRDLQTSGALHLVD